MSRKTWIRCVVDTTMSRKTWIRCVCGRKLHAKQSIKLCYTCTKKAQKKGKNSERVRDRTLQ